MAGPLTLEQIITFLMGAPMFGDLDAAELSQIVHLMQIQYLREGQTVFREGQPGDAWYVVFEGSVEVLAGDPIEGERVLLRLGPPACFGEMAILDGSPRSATVRASERSTVFRFPRADFRELLQADNLAAYKLVYHMAQVLVARQRQTTARLVELVRENQELALAAGLTPIIDDSSRSE